MPGVKAGPSGAAAPDARAKQVSLVEVSESTVTLLKLLFTAAVRACDRSGAAMGTSVVMTAIIVAMFGMIMPAPLHIPPTVKVTPGYPMPSPEKLTEPCLGQVSVVMMARAAVRPSTPRPADAGRARP